jgi:UDP-N-acetylglucosamine 2-epimerase (non-hydrolysing)
MLKIMCIVGVRPNFVKLAGMIDSLKDMSVYILHTGQHYDDSVSGDLWEDLSLPKPDAILPPGMNQPTMIQNIIPKVKQVNPDMVLVVGDAKSSLAGALVAYGCDIDVIHVEAGLRSFDLSMPEERNRITIDQISKLHFVTEQSGMDNLGNECLDDNAHLVGNVMIDAMHRMKPEIDNSTILNNLELEKENYVLCTFHRPGNVDDFNRLSEIDRQLFRINKECPVILPQHPRTKMPTLKTFKPLVYSDFIRLLTDAKMVITDSGGAQEEAVVVQTQCLTVRENTERPITLTGGRNTLIGCDSIYSTYRKAKDRKLKYWCPPLWDGRASQRIVEIIKAHQERN